MFSIAVHAERRLKFKPLPHAEYQKLGKELQIKIVNDIQKVVLENTSLNSSTKKRKISFWQSFIFPMAQAQDRQVRLFGGQIFPLFPAALSCDPRIQGLENTKACDPGAYGLDINDRVFCIRPSTATHVLDRAHNEEDACEAVSAQRRGDANLANFLTRNQDAYDRLMSDTVRYCGDANKSTACELLNVSAANINRRGVGVDVPAGTAQ